MTEKDLGYGYVKIHSSLILSDVRTNCHACINK